MIQDINKFLGGEKDIGAWLSHKECNHSWWDDPPEVGQTDDAQTDLLIPKPQGWSRWGSPMGTALERTHASFFRLEWPGRRDGPTLHVTILLLSIRTGGVSAMFVQDTSHVLGRLAEGRLRDALLAAWCSALSLGEYSYHAAPSPPQPLTREQSGASCAFHRTTTGLRT